MLAVVSVVVVVVAAVVAVTAVLVDIDVLVGAVVAIKLKSSMQWYAGFEKSLQLNIKANPAMK